MYNENNVIIGRNAVLEALRAGVNANAMYISSGESHGSIKKIIALAKEQKIVIKTVTAQKLSAICEGEAHSGVCIVASPIEYAALDELLSVPSPFIVICDGIEDPHNLGAIVRSAACAGASGVVIPKRGGAGITPAAIKASAGAVFGVKIARVSNLAAAIEKIKSQGIWVYAADMDGEAYYSTDFSGAAALVLGSEGSGVSRLVKEKCDRIVSIPMSGGVSSLNVSVAGGIIMFEIARQHNN